MNFKIDLTTKQQNLLTQINYPVVNKEYSKDEIKQCVNFVSSHIMSLSSKNGDLSRELIKYDELIKYLMKNEK